MDRIPVSSSIIATVGHDAETLTLEVEFLNGSVYQYMNVPADVYNEMIASSSAGSYLAKNIKNIYPYSRV